MHFASFFTLPTKDYSAYTAAVTTWWQGCQQNDSPIGCPPPSFIKPRDRHKVLWAHMQGGGLAAARHEQGWAAAADVWRILSHSVAWLGARRHAGTSQQQKTQHSRPLRTAAASASPPTLIFGNMGCVSILQVCKFVVCNGAFLRPNRYTLLHLAAAADVCSHSTCDSDKSTRSTTAVHFGTESERIV